MDNYISFVFNDLKARKVRELHEHEMALEKTLGLITPKKSKILSRSIRKQIFGCYESMNIVIIGHLYIERLLNEVLEKELKGFNILQREVLNTFHKKTIFLKAQQLLCTDIAEDIVLFNKLRNKFSHNLNYNISDFDFYEFTCFKEYRKTLVVKREKDKQVLNRILTKHLIVTLEDKLCKQYPFLHLIDVE